jgi:hypothetical protein
MFSNRLAFAALGVACMAAAAGGGYLASRQNTVPTPASAAGAVTAPAPAPASSTTPDRPVQETEAAVGGAAVTGADVRVPSQPAATKSSREAAAVRRAESSRAKGTAAATSKTARVDPPALDRSWPSGAAAQPPAAPLPTTGIPPADAVMPRDGERVIPDTARAPEPPQKIFEELVVPADAVIGLQTDTPLSSERARVEDRVDARVTRDVRVNDRVVIPAGTKAIGTVTVVDRGGKFKERARLGIRFNSLVLADGTRLAISTETIYREGDTPNSASKVGGAAVGGAILGAILGGGKGAMLGGAAGAGAGSAVVMAGDRNAATLAAGSPLTVRILSPVTVTVEK